MFGARCDCHLVSKTEQFRRRNAFLPKPRERARLNLFSQLRAPSVSIAGSVSRSLSLSSPLACSRSQSIHRSTQRANHLIRENSSSRLQLRGESGGKGEIDPKKKNRGCLIVRSTDTNLHYFTSRRRFNQSTSSPSRILVRLRETNLSRLEMNPRREIK